MRSGVGNFTERTRTSSTRFTFKDSLLRFDSPTFIDETGLAEEPIYTDFPDDRDGSVYGLAVLADGRMYRSLITLGATTRAWSYFASALAGSIPSLSVAWTYAVFLYQTTSGYLRYRTYDGSTDVTTSISVGTWIRPLLLFISSMMTQTMPGSLSTSEPTTPPEASVKFCSYKWVELSAPGTALSIPPTPSCRRYPSATRTASTASCSRIRTANALLC